MIKPFVVFDKDKRAKKILSFLSKKIKFYNLSKSNTIIVIGGDGFMLTSLKKYQKFRKPFYGMNRGTFGFLMNKFKIYNIEKSISKAKLVSISPLEMKVVTKTGKTHSNIAIN